MMEKLSPKSTMLVLCGFVVMAAVVRVQATQRGNSAASQASADRVAANADDIGGVVSSSKGPEAGVWVIAETTDLPTKFRKIVVTDECRPVPIARTTPSYVQSLGERIWAG